MCAKALRQSLTLYKICKEILLVSIFFLVSHLAPK